MFELTPQNAFGEVLLDLISAQYSENYDQGIGNLMQVSGLSEEEIVGIIQGDFIVDDLNLLTAMAEAFPDADEDDLSVLVSVADQVSSGDMNELVDEIDQVEEYLDAEGYEGDTGYEGGGDMVGAGAEGAGFSARANEIYFSQLANENRQLQAGLADVNNRLANFAATESLSRNLEALDASLHSDVQRGLIPPSFKSLIIGNFSAPEERLATFANVAASNNVSIETMLFAANFAHELLRTASNVVDFTDYSVSEEDIAIAKFSANADAIAKADLDAIFQS